jgi:predicted transcriptional regulator
MNHSESLGDQPMTVEAFTVRAEPDIMQRLDHLAARLDRSRNYLVNQAIREYLDLHAWQIEKTQEGIEAANRGQLTPHEEVMAEMDALIQESIDRREDRL